MGDADGQRLGEVHQPGKGHQKGRRGAQRTLRISRNKGADDSRKKCSTESDVGEIQKMAIGLRRST